MPIYSYTVFDLVPLKNVNVSQHGIDIFDLVLHCDDLRAMHMPRLDSADSTFEGVPGVPFFRAQTW